MLALWIMPNFIVRMILISALSFENGVVTWSMHEPETAIRNWITALICFILYLIIIQKAHFAPLTNKSQLGLSWNKQPESFFSGILGCFNAIDQD